MYVRRLDLAEGEVRQLAPQGKCLSKNHHSTAGDQPPAGVAVGRPELAPLPHSALLVPPRSTHSKVSEAPLDSANASNAPCAIYVPSAVEKIRL